MSDDKKEKSDKIEYLWTIRHADGTVQKRTRILQEPKTGLLLDEKGKKLDKQVIE